MRCTPNPGQGGGVHLIHRARFYRTSKRKARTNPDLTFLGEYYLTVNTVPT